jgi:amidase
MTKFELSDIEICNRRAFLKKSLALLGTGVVSFSGRSASASALPIQRIEPSELAFASARDAARAIRAREVSSLELTDYVLERIKRYNPRINAIVVPSYEQARTRASEADEALAKGNNWGPLHGIPVTVKESFDVAGLPTTWGNPDFTNNMPLRDATAVARLRSAGAILLGKTNVPFMLADWQAFNSLYGATNNPWNIDRTPGGSTGGGAAALAAGLSYLSLGSDLGGSIRVPAHFCGVFGHKPSYGVVPSKGHSPPPYGIPRAALPELPVAGPLARSAADIELALEIMGGPEDKEALAYSWTLPQARGTRLVDYRLGYVLDHPHAPVASHVKDVLSATIEALRKAGARLEEGWPEGVDSVKQYDVYMYLLELYERRDNNSDGVVTANAAHSEVQTAMNEQLAARISWRNYFRTHDAFLLPTSPIPAFQHDHSGKTLIERKFITPEFSVTHHDMYYWIHTANLAGLPATVAPVGLTPGGLPVGIQVLGPYLEDATSIAIGGHVADVMGGFRAPAGYRG